MPALAIPPKEIPRNLLGTAANIHRANLKYAQSPLGSGRFGEEMQAAGLSEVFIIQGERGASIS
jgi:hypothetical protein